jgi:hypothetical protein
MCQSTQAHAEHHFKENLIYTALASKCSIFFITTTHMSMRTGVAPHVPMERTKKTVFDSFMHFCET